MLFRSFIYSISANFLHITLGDIAVIIMTGVLHSPRSHGALLIFGNSIWITRTFGRWCKYWALVKWYDKNEIERMNSGDFDMRVKATIRIVPWDAMRRCSKELKPWENKTDMVFNNAIPVHQLNKLLMSIPKNDANTLRSSTSDRGSWNVPLKSTLKCRSSGLSIVLFSQDLPTHWQKNIGRENVPGFFSTAAYRNPIF